MNGALTNETGDSESASGKEGSEGQWVCAAPAPESRCHAEEQCNANASCWERVSV